MGGLRDGYYVKPTIFADVNNQMTIAKEEIFGPVLAMIPYDTEVEAIEIANDTIYGLNNAVASSSKRRCVQVASKLRSGMVMINGTDMDVKAPFGGYKQSGNAREWGLAGLMNFCSGRRGCHVLDFSTDRVCGRVKNLQHTLSVHHRRA